MAEQMKRCEVFLRYAEDPTGLPDKVVDRLPLEAPQVVWYVDQTRKRIVLEGPKGQVDKWARLVHNNMGLVKGDPYAPDDPRLWWLKSRFLDESGDETRDAIPFDERVQDLVDRGEVDPDDAYTVGQEMYPDPEVIG